MSNKLIYGWGVYFCLLAIPLAACHNSNTRESTKIHTESTDTKDTASLGNVKFVNLIPDSLRTPKQKQLIKDLGAIIVKYVQIKNNHMQFTLSKSEFTAKGIPEQYYDLIQTNLKVNNEYFDKNGIKDMDKKWEKTVQEFRDSVL